MVSQSRETPLPVLGNNPERSIEIMSKKSSLKDSEAFALYNTKEEVDLLVAGIRRVSQMF